MSTLEQIKQYIPKEVLDLRAANQLHKLASARTGIEDFGLDSAVTAISKKAYYLRHINKAIAASINAVDSLKD